jgi:hypothetical protein
VHDDFQSNNLCGAALALAGLNQRKRAGVCVALVGASDRVPACGNGNVPPCAGVCASTITSVGAAWREAWLWWILSRALHCSTLRL